MFFNIAATLHKVGFTYVLLYARFLQTRKRNFCCANFWCLLVMMLKFLLFLLVVCTWIPSWGWNWDGLKAVKSSLQCLKAARVLWGTSKCKASWKEGALYCCMFLIKSLYTFYLVTAEHCFGDSLKHLIFSKTVKWYYVHVAEGDGISQLLGEKGCLCLSCIIVSAIQK